MTYHIASFDIRLIKSVLYILNLTAKEGVESVLSFVYVSNSLYIILYFEPQTELNRAEIISRSAQN